MTAMTSATPFWFLAREWHKNTMMNDFTSWNLMRLYSENVTEGKTTPSQSIVFMSDFNEVDLQSTTLYPDR